MDFTSAVKEGYNYPGKLTCLNQTNINSLGQYDAEQLIPLK